MQPEKLGPYRIERPLGRGGMGAVYVGVNEENGERAAVKVLAPAFAAEPNFRGRFAAEIETLKKLRHPNIVQLYGFGEEDGTLFYAMQLIEGDNLEIEIHRGRHFDWREVITIALDVCKALKHAHDRGIIHRDLKPANLLRADDGRILLSDFGIAKLFGGAEFTAAGGVIGTADYMAPEQAAGETVTPRSDLYSLGGVMFCLLAGRPPFQGRTIPDIIHQVRYTDAPLVGRFAPTTPVELESIIARLLEKDPKKRLPTAIALTNLLQAMANTAPQTVLDPDSLDAAEPPEKDFTLTAQTPTGSDVLDEGLATHPSVVIATDPRVRLTGGNEETVIHTAPPAPVAAHPAEPAAPPSKRFTPVSEEELGRIDIDDAEADDSFAWIKLTGAAVVIAGLALFGWYVSRPPTADQLYATITQTAEARDLAAAEKEIVAFLARFPDDERRPEIEGYHQEIELARLERVLERRARAARVSEGANLVEQTYLNAMQTARTNPPQAIEQLDALIAVFGAGPDVAEDHADYVELARKQVERLRQSTQQSAQDHRAALAQRLAAAEKLHASDPAAARAAWRGIVELYASQAWAEPIVAKARQRLQETQP